MFLIIVKRETRGRAQGGQLSSIFASSSIQERQRREGLQPARRQARGRDQGHRGQGARKWLRLACSLTKLKSGCFVYGF